MRGERLAMSCRTVVLFGATLGGVLGMAKSVAAQAITDLQTPDTPLVLKAQGSFYVGGEKSQQTQVELGSLGPGGQITVNQMYVRYMVPQGGDGGEGSPREEIGHGADRVGGSFGRGEST